MKFDLYKIKLDYAAVGLRKAGNFYSSDKDFIPSTTIRGAFLYPLVQKGKSDEELEEFHFSPAFPIGSAPSHALSPAGGRKIRCYFEIPNALEKWRNSSYSEVLKETKEALEKIEDEECLQGGSTEPKSGSNERRVPDLKPKVGDIVKFSKTSSVHKYVRVNMETLVQTNVGISKSSGSSKTNMLFAYEVKRFNELWVLSKAGFHTVGNVEQIKVGRNSSRGLGLGKVQFVREVDLETPGEGDVGYCLTPCLPSFMGKTYIESEEIRGSTGVYVSWYTWDKGKRGGLKPILRVLNEGTIIKVKRTNELDELWPAGLNMLIKIKDLNDLLNKVKT
ncbi:MAG: hypothetical protein QXL70_04400 [Metallosphaera sp.]